jgi:hypothetical protein
MKDGKAEIRKVAIDADTGDLYISVAGPEDGIVVRRMLQAISPAEVEIASDTLVIGRRPKR